MSRWRRNSESVGMKWGSKLEMGVLEMGGRLWRWGRSRAGAKSAWVGVGIAMWAEARQGGKVRLGSI